MMNVSLQPWEFAIAFQSQANFQKLQALILKLTCRMAVLSCYDIWNCYLCFIEIQRQAVSLSPFLLSLPSFSRILGSIRILDGCCDIVLEHLIFRHPKA